MWSARILIASGVAGVGALIVARLSNPGQLSTPIGAAWAIGAMSMLSLGLALLKKVDVSQLSLGGVLVALTAVVGGGTIEGTLNPQIGPPTPMALTFLAASIAIIILGWWRVFTATSSWLRKQSTARPIFGLVFGLGVVVAFIVRAVLNAA
jgi:hypothetical protein